MIDVAEVLVDAHGGAARCRAEIDEVLVNGRNAVVVLDAAGHVGAHFGRHFFRRHRAVRAERKDDAHVFIGHAQAVHLLDEDGHEDFAVGNARRVVADEGDCVARANDLFERLRADRMTDGVENGFADVFDHGEVFGADDLQNVVGFIVESLGASPVREGIALNGHDAVVSLVLS